MKFALRGFLLLLLLMVDVTVTAKTPMWIEAPQACLKTEASECLIKANEASASLDQGDYKIHAPLDTLLSKNAQGWRLLKGPVWVECAVGFTLSSLLGEAHCLENSNFVFIRDADKVVLRVLEGQVQLSYRGTQERLHVPAGYEIRLGQPLNSGQVEAGFPIAYNWNDTAKLLGKLNEGPKGDFVARMERMRPLWRTAALLSGTIAQDSAEREIANYAARMEEERRQREKSEAENREMRQLFRKKNYLD